MNGFDTEFSLLCKSHPVNRRVGSGLLPANKEKNRDEEVVSCKFGYKFLFLFAMLQKSNCRHCRQRVVKTSQFLNLFIWLCVLIVFIKEKSNVVAISYLCLLLMNFFLCSWSTCIFLGHKNEKVCSIGQWKNKKWIEWYKKNRMQFCTNAVYPSQKDWIFSHSSEVFRNCIVYLAFFLL